MNLDTMLQQNVDSKDEKDGSESPRSINEFGLELGDHKIEFGSTYEPVAINNWEMYLKTSRDSFSKRINYEGPLYTFTTNLTVLKTLAVGQFSSIFLVAKENEDVLFVVKSTNKLKAKKYGHYSKVINEMKILNGIRFPFAIYLIGLFKYSYYINLILPVAAGGDFYKYLKEQKRFDEPIAKFYAAQIVLALEYLHNLNIIFRDLKLENVMLDHMGYVKLIAFNLAKIVPDDKRTYTLCGTPEYFAPEVICNDGYGKSVDWWSFGVLVYEFCTGRTPFESEGDSALFEKILSGKFHIPYELTYEVKDLLKGLLQSDLTKRLGNLKRGVNDIKGHDWFSPIGWLTILNKVVSPPYVPHPDKLMTTIYYHEFLSKQNKLRLLRAQENLRGTRQTKRFTKT